MNAIPITSHSLLISKIEKKVMELTQSEKDEIKSLVGYFWYEPKELADRISELLHVDYNAIFDLL
jgi:hypothetical protein